VGKTPMIHQANTPSHNAFFPHSPAWGMAQDNNYGAGGFDMGVTSPAYRPGSEHQFSRPGTPKSTHEPWVKHE